MIDDVVHLKASALIDLVMETYIRRRKAGDSHARARVAARAVYQEHAPGRNFGWVCGKLIQLLKEEVRRARS